MDQVLTKSNGNRRRKRITSLRNDKDLDWSKLKAFADNRIGVNEMMICLSNRIENIVGKGENAGFQHFLLFPQCFQQTSSLRSSKVGIVWERVKIPSNRNFFTVFKL